MLENFKKNLLIYSQSYTNEKEKVSCFLKFIERTPHCLTRNSSQGHLTASAWIENKKGTRFLLTKHKKAGVWLQLGGHVENNADILSEAFREAREESGLQNLVLKQEGIFDIDCHFVPYATVPHFHYDVRYLLKSEDEDEALQISDESDDLAWFESVPEGSTDLERMFQKWKTFGSSPQGLP